MPGWQTLYRYTFYLALGDLGMQRTGSGGMPFRVYQDIRSRVCPIESGADTAPQRPSGIVPGRRRTCCV